MRQLVAQPNGLAVPADARAIPAARTRWNAGPVSSMCAHATTYGTTSGFGTPKRTPRWPSEPPR